MAHSATEARHPDAPPEFMIAPPRRNRWMRTVTALLGAWLALSALLWHHNTVTRINGIGVGILIALVGLRSLQFRSIRWANVVLACWVVLSAFLLPHDSTATWLNELIVGTLVLLLSLNTFSRSLDPGTRGEGLSP